MKVKIQVEAENIQDLVHAINQAAEVAEEHFRPREDGIKLGDKTWISDVAKTYHGTVDFAD